MKNLVLIRHAKSSWQHPVSDHLRPLNARGLRQIQGLQPGIISELPEPDCILTSPAIRAYQTALACVADAQDSRIKIVPELYFSVTRNLSNLMKYIDNGVKTCFIVSHNPWLDDALAYLINSHQYVLKTCHIAWLTVDDFSHNGMPAGKAKLHALLRPDA